MTTPAKVCEYCNGHDCPECDVNTTPTKEWRSNFEKYLEQVCFEANPTVLDDDMPDFFDDWLGKQSGEDYIRLADEYAKHILDQHSAQLVERERKRIEEIFKKEVPPHAMDLEDSVWLKRLLNKAFGYE